MTKLSITTNNAYDAVIIEDANGVRMHIIGELATFLDALKTGDDQDIDNWSGELMDDDATAESAGEIIAINDGATLTIVDADLLSRRREFWGA
jgi:hypothetical protein